MGVGAARLDRQIVSPRLIGEEQRFQPGPRLRRQSPPFLDRRQHRRLNTALGDDLWPIALAGDEHFAEARLGVLDWPAFHFHISSER